MRQRIEACSAQYDLEPLFVPLSNCEADRVVLRAATFQINRLSLIIHDCCHVEAGNFLA